MGSMKRNFRQDYTSAMDTLRFSSDVKETMVQQLMQIEQPVHRQNRPKRLVLTALAAALILATLTGAAAFTRWSKSAQNQYNATQQQKEAAEKSGLSSMLETQAAPDQCTQAADKGITITAQQTIVDKYSAMVVLRIEGFYLPEGETPSLTIASAEVKGVHTIIPPGRFFSGIVTDAFGNQTYEDGSPVQSDTEGIPIADYTAGDGSLEYFGIFTFSEGNDPVGKEIRIRITELGTQQIPDLICGNWELSWTLTGTADTLVSVPDTPIGNTGVSLLKTEISPISIFAAYKIDNSDGAIPQNDPYAPGRAEAFNKVEGLLAGFRTKDGRMHTMSKATGIRSLYSDAGVKKDYPEYADSILEEKAVLLTRSRLIGEIINPEDVDALVFYLSDPNGKALSEMAEKDLCIIPVA